MTVMSAPMSWSPRFRVLAGGAELVEGLVLGELAVGHQDAHGHTDLPLGSNARMRWLALSRRAAASSVMQVGGEHCPGGDGLVGEHGR